jgi:RNA polymerase sigma-70 factor (ECF subfamily)
MNFGDLITRHSPQIAAVVGRYTDCPVTAEEIKQKALIRAFEKLPLFRGDASFTTWLYTIVRTVALDHLSDQTRREENRSRYGSALPDRYEPGKRLNPYDAESIRNAVRTLPAADAMLLDLHYFQQRDIQEIATLLGCTTSHVRTKLSRARARAKNGLKSYFGSELNDLCPSWNQRDIPNA